jgi:uncharacterized protein (TIGR02246 family)
MMKRHTSSIAVTALVVAGLLLAVCGPVEKQTASIDEDALAREVKAALEASNAALVAEDVEGYLAHYMDDAVWMPPNAEEFIGKGPAKQRLTAIFAAVDVEGESTIEEQMVMGPNWVAVRGQYALSITAKEGQAEPQLDIGSFLSLWTRDADGKWKIACDIWNSDRGPTLAERAASSK